MLVASTSDKEVPVAVRVAAIWRVVARIAERSFRRGFQHGWEFSRRGESLKYDVSRWRFLISEDQSPEMLGGRIVSAVERLRVQVNDEEESILDGMAGGAGHAEFVHKAPPGEWKTVAGNAIRLVMPLGGEVTMRVIWDPSTGKDVAYVPESVSHDADSVARMVACSPELSRRTLALVRAVVNSNESLADSEVLSRISDCMDCLAMQEQATT